MADNSVRKVKLNFWYGIITRIITMAVAIVIPRIFIVSFGSEVNGFVKGLDQIFVYVALLEAGVGAASLQALYRPLGASDKDEVSGILSATNKFYNKTAVLYLLLVVTLAFVYPLFIDTTLDYWLMFFIVIVTGGSGVVAYFCHAKYKILLGADGRGYISSAIATASQVLLSLGKVVALLCGFGVIAVQSIALVLNIGQAIVFSFYVRKHYGWLDLNANPNKQALSQKKYVIVHQISTLIFNNTDVLLLTFACGLNAASVYAIYKTLINMIGNVFSLLESSVSFKLGQVFSDRQKFLRLYDTYRVAHVTMVFSLCSIALMFFEPFILLYTDGMDINYVYKYLPLLFVMTEILSYIRQPEQNVVTSYAGHFKQTQWRSILESAINLASSIVFVFLWDIYGVLLGTIVALLYRVNDLAIYANKVVLNRSAWRTYKTWLVNLIVDVAFVCLFHCIPYEMDSYIKIIFGAIIVCVVVIPIQFGIVFLTERDVFNHIVMLFRRQKERRK